VSEPVTVDYLVGWCPDGAALLFVRLDADEDQPGYARLLALLPGATAPTTAMALPSQQTSFDLAGQATASGRVRPGSPPFLIGPRLWPWSIGMLLLVVFAVWWRRRLPRLAAAPWETEHGTLV
jgi:hypothetical protein